MIVLAAAIADYASVGADGKLSIGGIFDVIWTDKFPTTHPIAYLVLRLLLEHKDRERKHKLEVAINNQDGKPFAKIEAEVEIGPIPAGRGIPINHIFVFKQLVFERADKFSIAILWNANDKLRIPLDVAIQAPPS